jgi:hypothetical protein
MKVAYKVTCWNEFDVDDSFKDELLSFIKDNPTVSAECIYDWYHFKTGDLPSIDLIEGTDIAMSVKQNYGFSTIEISDGSIENFEEFLYQNGDS